MPSHHNENFTIGILGKSKGFLIFNRYFENSVGLALTRFGILRRATIRPRLKTHLESVEIDRSKRLVRVRFAGREIWFSFDSAAQLDNLIINIFNVFFCEEYRKLHAEGQPVVDIGSNIGASALYFLARGAKTVYAYEAYPYSCCIAEKNIGLNHAGRKIKINNEAVLGKKGTIEVDSSYGNITTSQLHAYKGGRKINIATLEKIVSKYSLTNASLKVDCEGSEYDILLNTKSSILRRFNQIIVEYHFGNAPLISKLKGAGFRVESTRPRPSRGISACRNGGDMKIGIIYAHRK